MKYEKIIKARFISRPNRFVAQVEIDGKQATTHVKNTGRCRELLLPGATIYLEDFTQRMGSRKLAYSLIAVEKNRKEATLLVNMDSQAPNKVVKEALENGRLSLPGLGSLEEIKPEAVYGSSRLDFFVRDEDGREGYIEVKGVTLERRGVAAFPDAPTERGIKHLHELSQIARTSRLAYAIFVIQMEGMKEFIPNDETHKAFGDALRQAAKDGVKVLAYECRVKPESLELSEPVKVTLDPQLRRASSR